MKIYFSFFICAILLSSCNMMESKKSSSVPSSEIKPEYTIKYNEREKSGTAQATFSSKKKIFLNFILNGESNILYNNKEMRLTKTPIVGGHTYDTKIKTYTAEHVFTYTNNDGKVFVSKINMPAVQIEGKNLLPDSAGAVYFTISRKLESDETISIWLSGDEDLESESIIIDEYCRSAHFDEDSLKITLYPRAFRQFKKSKDIDVTLSVEKFIDDLGQFPSGEGSIKATYESEAVIILKD